MTSRVLLVALFVLTAAAPFAPRDVCAAETLAEAFRDGEAHVHFRYRFEYVDQDAFALDAEASTLRGRINFKTDAWNGVTLFGEFDYVTDIGWDDYNAGAGNTPDKAEYPVVADPTGPDLNQAYIDWTSAAGTSIRGGRQRITLDNQRFVGAVGWRQNEQTFDAAYFNATLAGVDLQLAYLWQVNRIFGRDVPAGEQDHATPLLNLSRQWENRGKLSAYYYDIDNEDTGLASSRTLGLRWAGKTTVSRKPVTYTLEYASQDDAHGNPLDYSADYYRLDLAVEFGRLTPSIGFESLGGDPDAGGAFQTPLATLHGFNGWADKFLSTPPTGLNDLFIGLKGPLGAWTWNVIYHDFDAESGGGAYGSEIDASISRKYKERYGLLFKGARFDGDRGAPFDDVTKLWLQFTADF